jgi:hypothetical protein
MTRVLISSLDPVTFAVHRLAARTPTRAHWVPGCSFNARSGVETVDAGLVRSMC